MGKKARRKRQHKKSSSSTHTNRHDDNEASQRASAAPKGPVILQRIRAADPKTRHAALSALANTSFDPDVLQSASSASGNDNNQKKNKNKVNSTLVQAVREQLMDRDISCAIAAAGCLANYAAFSNDDEQNALTAGWIVLLVGRLKDCLAQLPDTVATATAAADNNSTAATIVPSVSKKTASWLEFAERCLTCLVHLLENNPLAVERLLPPPPSSVSRLVDTQQQKQLRHDTMWVLVELLRRSSSSSSSSNFWSTSSATNLQTLSCRCLHSAWEDNPDLVLPWRQEQPEIAKQAVELLQTLISNEAPCTGTATVTTTARLHAAGAWLSLWSLDGIPSGGDGQQQDVGVVADCMSLLHQQINWNTPTRTAQVKQLQAAFAGHLKQQEDSELERQVLTEQERKKEPARLIARRLKKNKDEAMMVEDTGTKSISSSGTLTTVQEQDTAMKEEEESDSLDWEDACHAWSESCRPVQLALEITANLTSAAPADVAFKGDDEDETMMDVASLNPHLAQALLANSIPDRVVGLLRTLTPGAPNESPEIVKETVWDLQSKTAVCIGHCLANLSGNSLWILPTELWQDLREAWRACSQDNAREAIGSAMVMTLQRLGGSGTSEADLDFLLTMLQSSSPVVVRDAVCMLGFLLSSQSHAPELNHKVAQALMEATTSGESRVSAMVLSEVLNVLMDIYGDDDCHPAVFESLQVLSHFQRSLPVLKQRIGLEREASPEDIEQWKEIAMNAARFIQYKKGHDD